MKMTLIVLLALANLAEHKEPKQNVNHYPVLIESERDKLTLKDVLDGFDIKPNDLLKQKEDTVGNPDNKIKKTLPTATLPTVILPTLYSTDKIIQKST